jgi:hypothetical protein
MLRSTITAWHKAGATVRGWPQTRLDRSRRQAPYTLRLEDLPASLRADLKELEERLNGANREGPFRGDGPVRPLRQTSIKAHLFALRQAISALVLCGWEIETITCLRTVVSEKAVRVILTFYWERAIALRIRRGELARSDRYNPEDGVSAQTANIANVLVIVAKHYCKVPAPQLDVLKSLAADMTPRRQSAILPKYLDRLRELDEPLKRAKFLNVSTHLMRLAAREANPRKAARLASIALAIQILIRLPLRIGTLSQLRLDRNIHWDSRGLPIRFVVLPDQTKNNNHIEWPINPLTADMIQEYVLKHRPHLATPDNPWLFPPGYSGAGHRSSAAFGQCIEDHIAEHVQVRFNVNLFRALAVRLRLEDDPGALEDCRILLGDKTLSMVLRHYGSMEADQAAKRMDSVLARSQARAARSLPLAPPRRPRGTSR